ncbi:predicted protein [Uncinocarpus reesii 1704]|uniref:Uncharacterized protein n=1 Tax=Uncinocarpus reesii (strain UAMH 1704) TaxID=336963 RepID=C4JZE2_UNCRE|nr:uncharacterized protein UREG_07543 [Uncinocarpus reesii 1704]EEP82678.1 predicted protein [Uncinocarpus reesii 1704]
MTSSIKIPCFCPWDCSFSGTQMATSGSFPGPAPAILASALLPPCPAETGNEAQRPAPECNWDLQCDIDKGISLTSAERSVFGPGRVVGISGLQPGSVEPREQKDKDSGVVRSWVLDLSTHLILSLLTRPHLPPSRPDSDTISELLPQAFIIQFYGSRTFTREYLLGSIQQKLPEHSMNLSQAILNSVKIFRAFNFDEIVDAISQISNTLYTTQQQQTSRARSLLLLEDLDQSVAEIQRTSSTLATQARLVPLLRTLTVLSRTHATHLTVIVVNTILLPSSTASVLPEQSGAEHTFEQSDIPPQSQHFHRQNHYQPVCSIFSPAPLPRPQAYPELAPTQGQSQVYSSSATKPTSQHAIPHYPSSLARSFDQGFDTHLLVSKKETSMIIEVAKDRVGNALGRWRYKAYDFENKWTILFPHGSQTPSHPRLLMPGST